jgi:hypothetical protein
LTDDSESFSDSHFKIPSDNVRLLPFRFGEGRDVGEREGFTRGVDPSPPTTSAFDHMCCESTFISVMEKGIYLVHSEHVNFVDIKNSKKFVITKNLLSLCWIL